MKLLASAVFRVGRRWQTLLPLVFLIAALGAASAWWEDAHKNNSVRVSPAVVSQSGSKPAASLLPDSSRSLAAFPVSDDGPLGIDPAIRRTRLLVKLDRSNVDCSVMKCLALTFDDGPHPRLTPELLDILKQRSAVATFFVLGLEIPGREKILKRASENHNEISNHTWSHKDLTKLTDKEIAIEVKSTGKAIIKATGVRPNLMRPPMGFYDRRIKKAVRMPLAFWSIDPRDWRDRNPELIRARVLTGAKPGRVVLLHDIYPTTIKAVPDTISELQRRGYVLVTMSELFGITKQNQADFNGRVLRYR